MTSTYTPLESEPLPGFRAAWIVHEEPDLVVVDKPAGVPCATPEARYADDLTTRLRQFLAVRDGVPVQEVYLALHGGLPQAASGLVLFSRRSEMAARLATLLERGGIQQQYLVGVTGYQPGAGNQRPGARPSARGAGAAKGRRGGGRKASALRHGAFKTRLLQRHEDRAVLALQCDVDGGRFGLCSWLADRGTPVAGDARYSGAPAPRLLLHLERLRLVQPDGRTREWVASTPPAFELWLARGLAPLLDRPALQAALPAAVASRYRLWHARDLSAGPTTAFRLVHGEGDGLPGLTVDVYGEHLVANLYDGAFEAEAEVLEALRGLGFAGVYVKRHPRQKNEQGAAPLEELCPTMPLCGEPAPDELVVTEYGVPFGVRLGDGWRTGLFLDQRENRRRVADLARGKRLLNLFAYTGGFSVAALQAGASAALCLDASGAALARAKENVARIGAQDRYRAWTGDVFELLPQLRRKGERFDVIVLDPPSYATTKRHRFRAAKDYASLVALVLPVLADGGYLLSCLNHHQVSPARLRAMVAEGGSAAGIQWQSHRDLSPPWDFPSAPGQLPLFKSVLSQRSGG